MERTQGAIGTAEAISEAVSSPGYGLLEVEIGRVGAELAHALGAIIERFGGNTAGPNSVARALGVDKVLASRVLKALRAQDPLVAVQQMPGPEPLRRLIRSAARRNTPGDELSRAEHAIGLFDALIRERFGDRALLETMLSAWVPEARREFELRRKQAAFRALSELKGVHARVQLGTAVLSPSDDGASIDIVWLQGLYGLRRVRPGAVVKLLTRRMTPIDGQRSPQTLDGRPIEEIEHLLLPEFCSSPTPRPVVHRVGQSVQYLLESGGFGGPSAVDLLFAEVNRHELPRFVPTGSGRLAYFYASVSPPSEILQFDLFVHADLYRGADPSLRIYDTAILGDASVNDPSRDTDQLDMLESLEPLGVGPARARSSDAPRYADLVRLVFDRTGWDWDKFRGYRCRVDYPLYGSQVVMTFPGVEGGA